MKKLLMLMALVVLFAGCSGWNDDRGIGDAPIGEQLEAPRDVYVLPDRFANVAVFCDGPARVYVTTREAPPVVVLDHPACDEGSR